MILHALNELYKRLAEDAGSGIPPRGFSWQPVPFALEIAPDGTLKQVLDLRDDSKKRMARLLVLPEPLKTSGSGVSANFLWDNTGYVLGVDTKGKPERSSRAFRSFRERIDEVGAELEDEGLAAVRAFLDAWDADAVAAWPDWKDMVDRNLVFRLAGDACFVHERPGVKNAWLAFSQANVSKVVGQCLVTGNSGPVNPTHPKIRGVKDAQGTGASLVSFNADAFTSYGKEQSCNAPVSEEAAFNYTTALNDLLKRESRQKVQIGDATTVFWTEKKSASESLLPFVFSQAEDQGDLQKLRLFLEALCEGKLSDEITEEEKLRFHVLGLSPNVGRISVRFWHVDTVGGMWAKVRQHFDDLRIVKRFDKEPDFPPHWLLLKAASLREDLDNLSPLLSGALMRSILTGAAYPAGLLSSVMGRIRAEQEITYARAALVKACLVRNARLRGETSEVITVSLDESSTNPAYLLGRLFAVLEKLQQEAIPGANATIKDRYFGSASATPRAVFPVLLRLSQHHISKIEYGRTYDRRIQDILDGLNIAEGGFPAHLSLEEQGLFALGYYHQRKDLWTSKKDAAAKAETANHTPTEG
jgi:CRISPR-associated protein Csd1